MTTAVFSSLLGPELEFLGAPEAACGPQQEAQGKLYPLNLLQRKWS